jgi:hypothetical protein
MIGERMDSLIIEYLRGLIDKRERTSKDEAESWKGCFIPLEAVEEGILYAEHTRALGTMLERFERVRSIHVLFEYDILSDDDTDDLHILFGFDCINSPVPEGYNPILFYDGGKHAILLKNENTVIVCDQVHPDIRKTVSKMLSVDFVELDDGVISEEYTAEMLFCPETEQIAEELIKYHSVNNGRR